MPWRTPGTPLVAAAPPAASTPTSRAAVSTKPAKVPAAFDPPPTQATTTSGGAAQELVALAAGLVPDHPLELAHHVGERVRPHHRAEAVVGVLDGGHPLAQRLVDRVLERAAAGGDRAHLGAEELHPEHVELLALRVDLAHEHRALEAEQRRRGRGGHPVLAGAGLGDHPVLAHPLGEQRLADHVVELVASRCGPGPRA